MVKIQELMEELKRAYQTYNCDNVMSLIKKILKKTKKHRILLDIESKQIKNNYFSQIKR